MAVYQPSELKFTDKKFSMIIYAAPGTGKTTLACSAPKPFLIDLDKGIERVKAAHRVALSRIDKYEELTEDFGSNIFKDSETVIIDTGGALITYLQDYVMRKDSVNRQSKGGVSQKGWGAVKQEFSLLVNTLKTTYNKNVIFVFHSLEEKNKDGVPQQRLLCEGSAKNIVWQPCDFGCYLYMEKGERIAGFTPTDEYFAKGCYGIEGLKTIPQLNGNAKNDFLIRLFNEARQNIASESMFFEEEKKRYEDAVKEGQALIDEVKDLASYNILFPKFKEIQHCLTSEHEIKNILREKLKELNFVWNADKKVYEVKADVGK